MSATLFLIVSNVVLLLLVPCIYAQNKTNTRRTTAKKPSTATELNGMQKRHVFSNK